MSTKLHKAAPGGLTASLVLLAGMALAEPLQTVVSLDVEHPAAFVSALDTMLESDDLAGNKVSLWASVFDGTSPTTHVVVAEYDDYESYERRTARRLDSGDWARFLLAIDDASEVTNSALHIQRIADGSGWRNHDFAAVFIMTVKDPAAYAAAFTDLIDAMDNPGSVRLMEIRAGGMGATHLAIITGDGMAAVNNYLDRLLASDAYRDFAGKVGEIRRINTVSMYRRVRTYGD